MNSFNQADILKVSPKAASPEEIVIPEEKTTPQVQEPSKKEKAVRKAKAIAMNVVGILIGVLIAAALGTALYIHDTNALTKKRVTDLRECEITFKDGSRLTGHRTYSYQYNELFGWRWYDASTVVERTSIRILGEAVSIVGVNKGDESWSLHVGQGEDRLQLVIPAERYVFMYGDKRVTAVVDYREICE